jgi:hypothetical protein
MPSTNAKALLDSFIPRTASTPAEIELQRLREIEKRTKDLIEELVPQKGWLELCDWNNFEELALLVKEPVLNPE